MAELQEMNIVMERAEDDGTVEKNFDHDSVTDILQTCRVCACVNNYFIPIYDGEGVEHDLGSKINQYLPINVSEADELPTQLCYQCASLLITWHEMFIGSLKAEEDLRKLKQRLDDDRNRVPKGAEGGENAGKEDEEGEAMVFPEQPMVAEMSDASYQPGSPTSETAELKTEPADDDSQDYESLVDIDESSWLKTEPLGPLETLEPKHVEIKYTLIEPLKLPGYSKFMVCKICGECINTDEQDMSAHEENAHAIKSEKPKVSRDKPKTTREKSKQSPQMKNKNLSCVCEYCGKSFDTVKKAAYHRRYTHMRSACGVLESSPKVCELCGAVLKSAKKLREHKKNRHVTVRNFECVVCSMKFKVKETLVNHQRHAHNVFIGEKYQPSFHRPNYPCSLCGIELASKFSLRRHLLIKHNHKTEEKWSFKVTTYECDHCDRIFKNKISFLRHQDKIADGKLEKRFYCDICSKGFFCHTDYTRHYRTHKQNTFKLKSTKS